MICTKALPFLSEYLDELNSELRSIKPGIELSSIQRKWFCFCLAGVLVTSSLCWSVFERFSLGRYSVPALSWMMRRSKIFWEYLLLAAVRVILKKYKITSGHLVIDDTDRQRSKSTTELSKVHKIFDKKTGGYFMGQNLVFLLLVTEKITLPVGFAFYEPDPKRLAWNKEDEQLRDKKVPKSQRPAPPPKDSAYPTKIELGLQLLSEFKMYFSEIDVRSISVDAGFGSADFFHQTFKMYSNSQIISQLRNNQKVFYRGELVSVASVFKEMNPISVEVPLRGSNKKVTMSSARLRVESHDQVQFVVALKYEGEEEYRYLVANDLSWRAVDIVRAYSMRWLVEVFIEDWKKYEGWGQMALQQGDEGSFRGVVLSLLVDLCLIFHPNQFARIENKSSACTVGSLREQLKNESLLACFHEILLSESPVKKFAELQEKFSEFFVLRDSKKHLSGVDQGPFEGTPSLKKKFGSLKLCQV